MAVPVSQALTVATYVLKQKLTGRKKYPLVLMLEPLFRCNLACAGCGKIQYPAHILKAELTPEECFQAAEECGYDAISFSEHPAPSQKWLNAGGHESLDQPSALAFCAAVTSRLRLMTYLLVLP